MIGVKDATYGVLRTRHTRYLRIAIGHICENFGDAFDAKPIATVSGVGHRLLAST